ANPGRAGLIIFAAAGLPTRSAVRRVVGRVMRTIDCRIRSRGDPPHCHAKISEWALVNREEEGRLAGYPKRGVAVVGATDVVVVIARHVPEHVAKLIELNAGDPVCAVSPQADHPDFGDIGMIDGRDPTDFGHGPGIGRAKLDLDSMALVQIDLAAPAPQALTLEDDKILLRRIAGGFESKDRAFGLESFERRQIISKAAHWRRLIHGRRAPLGGPAGVLIY